MVDFKPWELIVVLVLVIVVFKFRLSDMILDIIAWSDISIGETSEMFNIKLSDSDVSPSPPDGPEQCWSNQTEHPVAHLSSPCPGGGRWGRRGSPRWRGRGRGPGWAGSLLSGECTQEAQWSSPHSCRRPSHRSSRGSSSCGRLGLSDQTKCRTRNSPCSCRLPDNPSLWRLFPAIIWSVSPHITYGRDTAGTWLIEQTLYKYRLTHLVFVWDCLKIIFTSLRESSS